MSSYKDHPYYTHQPFLNEILKLTTGDILECGCGDGSTVFIKNAINNTNRKLISLESNYEWLNKYTHLESDKHKLFYVPAGTDDTYQTGLQWVDFIKKENLIDFEVVFIDSSPWMSRKACLDYFLSRSKIIVIHDFDYFPKNNIFGKTVSVERFGDKEKITCDLSSDIKNYKLFYPPFKYFAGNTGPPTLVCSNLITDSEFTDLIEKIQNNLHLYYD